MSAADTLAKAGAQERPGPGHLLTHAFELINARGSEYNEENTARGLEQHFREAAAVASVVIGKQITARDVAMIMHCVKLIRSKSAPEKLDNYVDGVNYLAFAACFTGLVPIPPLGAPPPPAKAPVALKEVRDTAAAVTGSSSLPANTL